MSHNFTTLSLSCLRRSARAESLVRARIITFGVRDFKFWKFAWFSPGTFHSPVSILTLTLRTHTITTVHTTQSHNSTPSLTKISICDSLNNINKEPSQQVGVLYTESYGLVSGLNSCTLLRGQRRNW